MKKSIILFVMVLTAMTVMAQKIGKSNGYAYKVRKNGKQIEVLDSVKVGYQTEPAIGLIEAVKADTIEYGRHTWLVQQGDIVLSQEVNRLPFKIYISGRRVANEIRNLTVVLADSNHVAVRDARIRLAKERKGKTDTIARFQYDEKALCYYTKDEIKAKKRTNILYLYIDAEIDGKNYSTRYVIGDVYHMPLRSVRNEIKQISQSYDQRHTESNITSYSWSVTDKNKYRPEDTLRWKIVAIDGTGKPMDKKVIVRFNGKTIEEGLTLNERGSAWGEIVLKEIDGLKSNNWYTISWLTGDESWGFTSTSIKYEDYELKGIKVTSDAKDAEWGQPVKISFKVTDEKDQPLMDGKIETETRISSVSNIYEDILVTDYQPITAEKEISKGEAEIEIPTETLPKADLRLYISWKFRSPDGEEKKSSNTVSYKRELPKEEPAKPSIYFDKSETYNKADSVGFKARCMGERFTWVIVKNGATIERGSDTLLIWKARETKDAVYELRCISMEGNKNYQKIVHSANQINLQVSQKEKVAPGEETEITVRATDLEGNPIEGMDLTAMSYTTKLGYRPSTPASWEVKQKEPAGRETYSFMTDEQEVFDEKEMMKIVNSDNIEYNRLVNNGGNFIEIDKKSSIEKSQIVPVLTRDGKIVPVSKVYLDYKLVYYAGTDDRYVITLNDKNLTMHNIMFYTQDTIYSIGFFFANKQHVKSWYSIPADKCEKTALTNQKIYESLLSDIGKLTNYVFHQDKGKGYMVRESDEIVYTSGTHLAKNGQYKEMRLDTTANDIQIFSGRENILEVFGRERIICTQREESSIPKPKKRDKNYRYRLRTIVPELNDSLMTEEEVRDSYMRYLESYKSSVSDVQSGYFNNMYKNTEVAILNNSKKNIEHTAFAEKGEQNIEKYNILNGAYYLFLEPEKSYDIVFIYDDGTIKRVDLTVPGKEKKVYVNATYDSTRVVKDSFAKALDQRMLKMAEEMFTRSGDYKDITKTYIYGNNGVASNGGIRIRGIGSVSSAKGAPGTNATLIVREVPGIAVEEEDVVYDEVVAVAYGSAPKKSIVGSDAMAKPEIATDGQVGYMEEAPAPDPDAEIETEIRENFKDAGYWVPDAVTDKNGEARIKVKYTDDLTQWETLLVAIKGKQRGYHKARVTATKDVVGQLKMPRFAIEGDSVGAIGIGTDYINNVSEVDTFYQTATGDSLCVTYVYKNDGEKRCVPVYKQGMEEIEGEYKLIERDTTFQLAYNKEYGKMKIGVYGDVREMMMESIKKISASDWCGSNDYLAMKLEALRMQPQTDSVKTAIAKIEKRLRENRLSNGMWGWYGKFGGQQLWVTERVVRALGDPGTMAMKFEISRIFDIYKESNYWSGMFQAAKLFGAIGDTAQMRIRLQEIDTDSITLDEKIEWLMSMDREIDFDTLRHTTYTDGEYYGENDKKWDRYCCWIDPVMRNVNLTMKAYKYYEQRGETDRCRRIKLWLMQYTRGRWMPDDTKLQIVKTIWGKEGIQMKDVLYQLSIGDRIVDKLPFTIETDKAERVDFKGNRDIYIGTEQTRWEEHPEKQSNGMSVESHYEKGVLTVDFTLENDAEYLVVCCPIPAGCSYEERQPWNYGESGREQYRDKVYIYFNRLLMGQHQIKIKLNERYPGRYTINPSQAKLIYFPVFNGNGEMQVVEF